MTRLNNGKRRVDVVGSLAAARHSLTCVAGCYVRFGNQWRTGSNHELWRSEFVPMRDMYDPAGSAGLLPVAPGKILLR